MSKHIHIFSECGKKVQAGRFMLIFNLPEAKSISDFNYPCIWVKHNSWLKQAPVCMTLSIPRHSMRKRYRLIIITISYSCMFGNWNSAASCRFPVAMATRPSTLATWGDWNSVYNEEVQRYSDEVLFKDRCNLTGQYIVHMQYVYICAIALITS